MEVGAAAGDGGGGGGGGNAVVRVRWATSARDFAKGILVVIHE